MYFANCFTCRKKEIDRAIWELNKNCWLKSYGKLGKYGQVGKIMKLKEILGNLRLKKLAVSDNVKAFYFNTDFYSAEKDLVWKIGRVVTHMQSLCMGYTVVLRKKKRTLYSLLHEHKRFLSGTKKAGKNQLVRQDTKKDKKYKKEGFETWVSLTHARRVSLREAV